MATLNNDNLRSRELINIPEVGIPIPNMERVTGARELSLRLYSPFPTTKKILPWIQAFKDAFLVQTQLLGSPYNYESKPEQGLGRNDFCMLWSHIGAQLLSGLGFQSFITKVISRRGFPAEFHYLISNALMYTESLSSKSIYLLAMWLVDNGNYRQKEPRFEDLQPQDIEVDNVPIDEIKLVWEKYLRFINWHLIKNIILNYKLFSCSNNQVIHYVSGCIVGREVLVVDLNQDQFQVPCIHEKIGFGSQGYGYGLSPVYDILMCPMEELANYGIYFPFSPSELLVYINGETIPSNITNLGVYQADMNNLGFLDKVQLAGIPTISNLMRNGMNIFNWPTGCNTIQRYSLDQIKARKQLLLGC